MDKQDSQTIKTLWKRIETWRETNAPTTFAQLKPGASEERLRVAQTVLGVAFPPYVAESCRIYNGAEDTLVSVAFAVYNLDRILSEWSVWKELLDGGEFEGESGVPGNPGIRPDWWNEQWIPITGDGGGNHLCIDLAPAEGGTLGQIITMWHDDTDRDVIALSFGDLLRTWADDLEAGVYVQTRKYGLSRRDDNSDEDRDAPKEPLS